MKNISNHKIIKTVALMALILVAGSLGAQTSISLNNAFEKALENNMDLQTGKLLMDYQEKIKKSYAVVDPLSISGEIGQFNSDKVDNQISVSQGFRLPHFYQSQKQVLAEELKYSQMSFDLQKWQLKKELTLLYNELVYQDEKRKLLAKADSIYAVYFQKAELRLRKGESNILEKTTAENYRSQAAIQLRNLENERSQTLKAFNFLINSAEIYQNEKENFFSVLHVDSTHEFKPNLVFTNQFNQQKTIETARLTAEKAKLSPNFSIGINSLTIAGTTENNAKRFQSGILGIGIPVFNTGQKSVIEGQKIKLKIAENNMELNQRKLKNKYELLILELEKLQTEQNYYKTKGLSNAKTIIETANRLYYTGEINYLEWSIVVNQSLEIENKYIDNQKLVNEKIIELDYLQGK